MFFGSSKPDLLKAPIEQKRSLVEAIGQRVRLEDNDDYSLLAFAEGTRHARSRRRCYTCLYALAVLEFQKFVGVGPDNLTLQPSICIVDVALILLSAHNPAEVGVLHGVVA